MSMMWFRSVKGLARVEISTRSNRSGNVIHRSREVCRMLSHRACLRHSSSEVNALGLSDGHRFLATRKPITSLRFPESEVSRWEERRGVGSIMNHGVPRMTRELQPELAHAAPSLGAP